MSGLKMSGLKMCAFRVRGFRLIVGFLGLGALAALIVLQGCGSGGASNQGPPPPPPANVGANVNEQSETASLYVDAAAGDDSNDGSQNSPFKTINKALSVTATNNQSNTGTQINVNPGIYREQLQFQASQTSAPFTLQAVTAGTVFVSGADSLPGNSWTVSSYGSNIFTHSGTSNYISAACDTPDGWPPIPPITLRREMVFVDGFRLDQVMFSNQLQPGTFWADANGTHQIYIWPPEGTNMATADIEVATASRSPLLKPEGVNNFVIRGLTFEYDNSCIQSGSRIVDATNVLIDNDLFIWNNAVGFGLYAGSGSTQNITVQNSTANHNGQTGFSGRQVKYVLYQNDESSYNSWRGALGGYYAYAFDGSDFFLHHNSDFNNLTANYNQSSGVHFDTDNANDQVSGLQAGGNNVEGLLIEASQGPFLVQNSNACSNSVDPASKTANIQVNDSSNVTLTGNTFYGAAPEQQYIVGGGRAGTDWEQPTVPIVRFNQHLTQTGNNFIGAADQLGIYTYYKNAPSCSVPISDMWQTFGGTFSSESNTWGDTAATNASYPFFQASILGGAVPLSTWQSPPPDGVGQDTSSTFVPHASAPSQCALPKPDIPNFWLILGLREGAAAIVPHAGGSAIQVPLNLVSLDFTGTVSLTVDTTQPDGAKVSGVSAAFSPQKLSLAPSYPLAPAPSTLTITTTSATPDGFYPLTVTATDGKSITRTGALFLQVGEPSALKLQGNDTIQKGACAIFQIHSVDSTGNTSEVLDSTYLSATGTGSGKFYQDSQCTTPIDFQPINAGCPAGIEIPPGNYSPYLEGAQSIWFLDPKAEDLSITISDEAGLLKSVTTPIQVQ
jgi:hypothetical protein